LFRSTSEDSALFASQRFRFPASRPDDVSSHPDARLFIVPSRPDDVSYRPDILQTKASLSRRCGFPSGHSSVSRSFCSSLHPSGRLSSPSRRLSVIDQASDFLSKSKYGKIAATVWTTWNLVQTCYSLRQVRNSNSTVRTSVQHI
jgi:hypothetical protein